MKSLIATLGALLLIGCKSTGLDPVFVGEFELMKRNGEPLPAPIPMTVGTEECLNDLLSGTLTINADGTWTESLSFRQRCGPGHSEIGSPVPVDEKGKTRFHGDEGHLVLIDSSGGEQIVVVSGDQLRMFVPSPGTGRIFEFDYRRAGT